MSDIDKAFDAHWEKQTNGGNEWSTLERLAAKEAFQAGFNCALHQQEQAEPVGWREAMQEFVDRCDRGEVISTYTYNKFKGLLEAEPQPKETGE